MQAELAKIIEEAYGLFKTEPPATVGVCECDRCGWVEDPRDLLTLPLRGLADRLFCDYNWAANLDDQPAMAAGLWYLLPRMLELVAMGQGLSFSDPVLSLRRLTDINFRTVWPKPNIDLVDRFFDAYLLDQIHTGCAAEGGSWRSVNEMALPLVLAVLGGCDLDRLLRTFDSVADPVGALQIANLRGIWLQREKPPRFADHFLDHKPDAQLQLGAWLMRPEHARRIEAIRPLVHPDLAEMLLEALA